MKLGKIGYVILWSRDTEKSLAFYRDTLGCKVLAAHPGWVELDGGGMTLALHGLDEAGLAKHGGGAGGGVPYEVVWNVTDVKAAHAELSRAGVTFSSPLKVVCEVPGGVGMAASFKDPDGHMLSVFGIVPSA